MIWSKCAPDVVSFTCVISSFARAGDPDRAERWLKRMQLRGIEPNVTAFNAILDACAKRGRLRPAEWWFKYMEDSNLQPDRVSFCSMLNACAKARNTARSQVWFDKMLKFRITADIIAYNAFISACAGEGRIAKAEELLQHAVADKLSPDLVTHNSLLHAWSRSGDRKDFAKANQYLARADELGLDVISFNCVLHACARLSQAAGSRACTSKFLNISFGAHAGELQCGDRCKMPGRRHRYSNVLDWCHGTAANRSWHPFFFTIGVRAVPHWRFASHAFPIHKNAQGGNCTVRFGGQQAFAAEGRPKSGLMLFRMGKKQVGTEKKRNELDQPPHPLTVSHHQDQYILSRESLKAFILQCYQVGG